MKPDTAAIRARAEKATKGPWLAEDEDGNGWGVSDGVVDEEYGIIDRNNLLPGEMFQPSAPASSSSSGQSKRRTVNYSS